MDERVEDLSFLLHRGIGTASILHLIDTLKAAIGKETHRYKYTPDRPAAHASNQYANISSLFQVQSLSGSQINDSQ